MGFWAAIMSRPKFYYITLPDGFTLSGNESVIQRTIDRYIGRKKNAAKAIDSEHPDEPLAEAPDPSKPLRPQIAMNVTGIGAETMAQTNYRSGLYRTHQIVWSNLPILNYLRQRYPERDPSDVYRQMFGQKLIEPTGGQYVWNNSRSTYVSSHHGYHLEQKAGPILEHRFGANDEVNTTLSFQDGGLRATLKVTYNE